MNSETIVIGIGAAFVELIFKPIQKQLSPLLKKLIDTKLRKNQKGVYERKVAINALLDLIERHDGVKKAVVVQTKNGGGVPKTNTPIYGTIIAPAKYGYTFNNRLLDSQYCDLVSNLLTKKHLVFTTEDLPDDSMLKDIFLTQGIKSCHCYDAAISKCDYIFIAIDYTVLPNQVSPSVRSEIAQQVSDLAKLLNT